MLKLFPSDSLTPIVPEPETKPETPVVDASKVTASVEDLSIGTPTRPKSYKEKMMESRGIGLGGNGDKQQTETLHIHSIAEENRFYHRIYLLSMAEYSKKFDAMLQILNTAKETDVVEIFIDNTGLDNCRGPVLLSSICKCKAPVITHLDYAGTYADIVIWLAGKDPRITDFSSCVCFPMRYFAGGPTSDRDVEETHNKQLEQAMMSNITLSEFMTEEEVKAVYEKSFIFVCFGADLRERYDKVMAKRSEK